MQAGFYPSDVASPTAEELHALRPFRRLFVSIVLSVLIPVGALFIVRVVVPTNVVIRCICSWVGELWGLSQRSGQVSRPAGVLRAGLTTPGRASRCCAAPG